jgi:hypothetical protein
VGNPYESSSAVASGKVVYAHGTGTVINNDIYETKKPDGATDIGYLPGDKLYASVHGLLTNSQGLGVDTSAFYATLIGVCLKAPDPSDPYMAVQLRI